MPEPEEHEFIRKAARGDSGAFRMLVSQNQSILYAVAYRFLGNAEDAEDVVQEVFIKLWKNLNQYRVEVKLSTWLYKMTVNHCLDVLKSAQRRRQNTHVDIVEQVNIKANTADQAVHAQELHVLVQEAASGLTPKQKAVFILRDLEGLPAEEVGRILSMSPQNIKSNLYYARQQVCERLKMIYQTTDKITTL